MDMIIYEILIVKYGTKLYVFIKLFKILSISFLIFLSIFLSLSLSTYLLAYLSLFSSLTSSPFSSVPFPFSLDSTPKF